jgi:hypothetical protein
MKKNVASQVVCAQLVSKTDGSDVTTGTTTVYVTGDAGTQATGTVGSGAATHEGNGLWSYAPAQAETNYDNVVFTFTNTAAVSASVQIYTSFPQTGDNYARLGAPAGASIAADIADVPTAVENADALLNRDMSTGTDSGSATVRTPRQALRFLRNKWDVAAGTLTVRKEDDSTTSWTAAVSTDAAAVPVIGSDPASA